MPICPKCERVLIEDAAFCPGCSLENPLDINRKKTKETPSIDSRKRDRFLCLVVSDLVDLETCKRKAPAENPNDYNAGKRKKGLDGNYWIVAKTWIQDNN